MHHWDVLVVSWKQAAASGSLWTFFNLGVISQGPQQVEWKTPPTRAPWPTSLLYSATAFCVCCTVTPTPCCLTKSRVVEGTWRRHRPTSSSFLLRALSSRHQASNTFCVVKIPDVLIPCYSFTCMASFMPLPITNTSTPFSSTSSRSAGCTPG